MRSPERVLPWVVAAILLAATGAALSIWRPTAPPLEAVSTELATFDPELLEAVEAYRRPKYVWAYVSTLLSLAVPLLVVFTRTGRRLVVRLAGAREHAPWRAALVAAAVLAATSLITLPLAAWSRVVHDGRWGFRTQSAAGWFVDWLTVSGLRWAGYGLAAAVVVVAVRRWPRTWPYRLTVIGPVLAAAIVLAHPVAFVPLLMPTHSLPDGPTRDLVEAVAVAAGETDLPLYVAEASRRTTRVNAIATGIGPTERVILYDTLLELPDERVAAVVAHELAHHQHRDVERGIALAATALLPGLLVAQRVLNASRTRRLVDARGPTDPRLVAPVMAVLAVAMLVGQPVAGVVQRQLEAAADARAVEITGDAATVVRMARAFTVHDLAPPQAPATFRFVYATHPSVRERIHQAVALSDDPATLPDLDTLRREEVELLHPAVGGRRP